MKKETFVTLKEVYEEARLQEGDLPPPEPPMAEDKRRYLEDRVSKKELSLLLKDFIDGQRVANENPGEELEGNVILGAPPHYYSPSQEELFLAAIGESIGRVLASLSSPEELAEVCSSLINDEQSPVSLEYLYYAYERVDVVGSGRFYYPMEPQSRSIDVLDELLRHVDGGQMLSTKSQDEGERLEILRQLVTLLG